MKLYENLTKKTSSTAFSVQLPDRKLGKGQRLSDVTCSLLLSVLFIFAISSTDVLQSFSAQGPWISKHFYYVSNADLYQLSLSSDDRLNI